MSKTTFFNREIQRNLFIWGALTPIVLWFVIYMFLPIISVFVYSFTDARMQYSTFKFVGLAQYVKLFRDDPVLPIALRNTVQAVIYIVPSVLVLSVLLACALNALGEKARQVFTFIYFLPSVVPMVAICLVWAWLYHPGYGLFNAILNMFGFSSQQFLQSSSQSLISVSIIQIWNLFGYYAIVLLAAMKGVSEALYEAAEIDGANSIQRFFKITVPMIKPSIVFVAIMSTISAFMMFIPVDVLTLGRGTPGTSTLVLMLHIKNRGIMQGETGYSSAMSILLLAIILAVSFVQWLLTREKSEGK